MVRRTSELTANLGVELQFLPMVRRYERDGMLNSPGVEAMVEALHRRVAAKHFADAVIPRWLVSRCGGYFRDLLSRPPGTLAAVTLGLRIRDRLGQIDAARTLAEDCRRRLRYVSPPQTILASLLEFFSQHGPPEVAASLSARMI